MKKTLAFILAISLMASPVCGADWVNDWIDQKTVSGPSYFHTQKKGYGSFGNYSARWYNPTEPVATLTPPRFGGMGCGGIDMFLGGFSFLKADYIVDKLKKMMGPAAAAFAYGIAMGALNAQAKSVLDNIQQASDFLNGLQLNECSVATRAMEFGKHFGEQGEPYVQKASTSLSKMASNLGASDSWYATAKNFVGKRYDEVTTQLGVAGADMNSGCPSDINNIFLTQGSILENIGGVLNYSTEQVRLIRGYVGDIKITTAAPYKYEYIGPCPMNRGDSVLKDMINGAYQKRNAADYNTQCSAPSPLNINGNSYPNIGNWINTSLIGIGSNIINQTDITDPGQTELLNRIPLPLLKTITTSIFDSDNPNLANTTTAGVYGPYVSSMIVYNMVGDFYAGIQIAINNVKKIRERHQGTTSPAAQCDWDSVDLAIVLMKNLENNLIELSECLYKEFNGATATLSEALAIQAAIQKRSEQLDIKIKDTLGKRFLQGT